MKRNKKNVIALYSYKVDGLFLPPIPCVNDKVLKKAVTDSLYDIYRIGDFHRDSAVMVTLDKPYIVVSSTSSKE